MDQLTALRALRRVVELGSFTAAGAALGISHSIVSRQIRQLEHQLGAQLLNRTTRRFALTAAGQEYYLARHRAPATPQDLLKHDCLLYSLGLADKPDRWVFHDDSGAPHAVTVRGTLSANTGIALRAAAVGGMGIAVTAAFIVREQLASGALVQVLPGHTMAPRNLYALYPHGRHVPPKVRALIDFALQWYAGRDWD